MLCGIDLEEIEGAGLHIGWLRQHGKRVAGVAGPRDFVQRQCARSARSILKLWAGILSAVHLLSALTLALSETVAGATGVLRWARAPAEAFAQAQGRQHQAPPSDDPLFVTFPQEPCRHLRATDFWLSKR